MFVGLVFALRTGLALIVICIQILTRNADGKVTVLNGLRARATGGPVERTLLAGPVPPLQSVEPDVADLAIPVDAELGAVLAVGPAVGLRQRLLGPSGQSHPTKLAGELTLQSLVSPVATGTAKVGHLVVILASRALLLAVGAGGGSHRLGHTLDVRYGGALGAGTLGIFRVVESDGTFRAYLFCFVKVSAWRTRNTLVVNHHLARLALETLFKDDRAGVKESSR